jgi:hypothetical protein
MKQFQAASRRGTTQVNNPVDIEFEYETLAGEPVTMTAHPPTSSQVSLFAIGQMEGGFTAVKAVFDLLSQILDPADWRVVERDLEEGVEIALMVEMVNYFTEVWSGRPTTRSSASSGSRRTTGQASTVKRASKATRSTSRSTVS